MVLGIDSFREKFKDYTEYYTIIGGTACDILLTEADLPFRATKDIDMISHGPEFIAEFARILQGYGVPIVTPAGGLGLHLNAREFVGHIPGEKYQAASLCAAIYIVSGARGMERGTLSEEKNPDGSEHIASCELVRLALPRRVFTLSQVRFIADRIAWLYENRNLIGGLKFVEEPEVMRFFIGRLEADGDWQEKLVAKFKEDFGESL